MACLTICLPPADIPADSPAPWRYMENRQWDGRHMADSEADDRVTVRGVPKQTREAWTASAKRAGISLGEWFCQAVDLKLQAERKPMDLLRLADRAADMPSRPRTADNESAMMAIGALQALAAAKTAGLDVSKAAARDAVRVVRAQVRQAGGLAPLKPRKRIGRTTNGEQEPMRLNNRGKA
jgi:hypothetical protein